MGPERDERKALSTHRSAMSDRRYRPIMARPCHLPAFACFGTRAPATRLAALLAALLAVLLAFQPARAAPAHIAAQLVAGPAAAPGGETMVVIRMTPEAGWHGYWSNPGDAGLGMQLDWQLPFGAQAGAPRYPVPQTLLVSGLMNHVYESEYEVLVPLRLPEGAPPGGMIPVGLSAQWLACTEQLCVPERAVLSTYVPVAAAGAPAAQPSADLARWEQRLPAPLDAPVHFAWAGSRLRLAIPLPKSATLVEPHLFVVPDKVVDYAAPQAFARKGDMLIVTLERARFAARQPGSIAAVLRLDAGGDGVSFTATPGTVPTGGTPVPGAAPRGKVPSLALLLLAAVVGGLLLNVMPCVFPILSLKALSLARAGESEVHARAEGVAYAAGVMATCVALGGALLLLRAGGQEIGWAFQLQEPTVVVALLLLALAITANLAGLYEIALPGFAAEGGPASMRRGAFVTGALAAFAATPCTGPFMATAMGAALLLPAGPALLLFAALGLGIALPFLALAFVPPLRRRLPRPGAWMERLRKVLAVPMALTTLALGWLVWRLGGEVFLAMVLGIALVLLVLLALVGRRQRAGHGARALAGLALLLALVPLAALPAPAPPQAGESSILAPRPFSEAALASALAAHRPVFVWMTADWCLSCKVNENLAIEREETRAAFERAGVVVLRGDWTRRDPAITRYLTERGAAGVPLYVWYGPNGRPEQLPQVLTPQLLARKAATSGHPRPGSTE